MDWTAHVNAFYAQWVPRYLDPSERPNPADLFTKILTRQPFEKHRKFVLNLPGDTGVEYARRQRHWEAGASSQRDGKVAV